MFKNDAAEFVYYRTYSKWSDSLQRRETWEETVNRVVSFLKEERGDLVPAKVFRKIEENLLNFSVLPSMRLVWSAGEAARKSNVCIYNCSFLPVDSIESFAETLYILCCGTGVGFSVEQKYVEKLPTIKDRDLSYKAKTCIVGDSKEAWADSVKFLMEALFEGKDLEFDYSNIRPKGAKLKTMGGRASGPEPLVVLHAFIKQVFNNARGRKLSALECHDIMNKIAEIVVSGGVRRCLPQNTLVQTTKGLVKIKDINVGDSVFTHKGIKKVTNKWNNGSKKLLKIDTLIGPVYSTPEHRWAVLKDLEGNVEYKEAALLTEQDSLVIIPKLVEGTFTELPNYIYNKPKQATTTKDIIIPKLDADMAWFFGQLHGDGYVYYNTDRNKVDSSSYISIACSNDLPEQHTRVVTQFERFGLKVASYNTHENCTKPRVVSQQLAEYLSNFKKPKQSIEIPSFISKGTIDIRAGYLAGILDSDGCILKQKDRSCGSVNVCSTVYEDFAIQLRALLFSLGIASKIKTKIRKEENWQTIYNITLIRQQDLETFGKLVGPYSSKWKIKNHLLVLDDRKKDQYSFSISPNMLKKSQYKNTFQNSYSKNIRLGWRTFEKIAGQQDFIPLKIIKTELTEKEDVTYDIEVEYDHNFIADSILTHNSSQISLSDLIDEEMRLAKVWPFPDHRAMANNSAVYYLKPTATEFLKEWASLANSGTGERGISNLGAARRTAPKRRNANKISGFNPCHEIALRSMEFCNLSEVVVTEEDDLDTLLDKVETATWLGVIQSSFTDFPYLRPDWKANCDEERLLGVSITGQMDNPELLTAEALKTLKQKAIKVAKKASEKMGLSMPTAITCVKPSGTVGQLVGCSSGLHPQYSKYYIRRYRISATDPLYKMMKDQGFIFTPENGQTEENATTWVVAFPCRAPENAVVKDKLTALDQLEWYKKVQTNWCEHNASCTVYVNDNEWFDVGNWVYNNWEQSIGVSFLPADGGKYKQAPYEEITKEQYEKMAKNFSKIDYSKLSQYEKEDNTEGAKTFACVGDKCDIV